MQQNSGNKLSVCLLLVQDPESPPPPPDADTSARTRTPVNTAFMKQPQLSILYVVGERSVRYLRLGVRWVGWGLSGMLFIVPVVSF